jgi:O-antigen/teichoic acid export membrane protein/glycosyltransferase involved in cell wall biosynthesis
MIPEIAGVPKRSPSPARKLRILYCVEGLDIGGANQSTVTTALAMKGRGHAVYYASREGPLGERLAAAGIPHIRVNTMQVHPNRRNGRILGEALDREGIDLVCPNGWDCTMDALLAAIPRGIPVVPTFPAVYPEYRHPRVPKAIVYSGEYVDALIRRYGWKPESLEILINRIDTSRFRPGLDGSAFRRRWGVLEGAPVVLMACRLDTMKIDGVRFFLDSLPALMRLVPDVRVFLAGDGEWREEVARRVAALNAAGDPPRVIQTGRVLDMEVAFSAADVVVGNGARSGLEGFACGKPVVSVGPSGLSGVFSPENIEDFAYYNFDKGRVFDGSARKEPEFLAETVASLLSDEPRRKALGEFGREFSERRLGIEAGTLRLEELYLGVRPRSLAERLRDRSEFLRSYLSFTWYRARRKARRVLFGLPPPTAIPGAGGDKEPGFLRNSATTFTTAVFGLGVGMVQAAIVARVLKPEGKGELTAALLLPQLLVTLAPLGINWASTYHLGRRTFHRETLTRSVLTSLILLGGVAMLLCGAGGILVRRSVLAGVSVPAFLLGVLTIPTQIAILFLNGLFRGEMRIPEANRMSISRNLLMFLCIVVFLTAIPLGVTGVVLAQVVAETAVAIVFFYRFGGVKPVPLLQWDVLRGLLGYGLQVYSFAILLYLNYRFDMFIVRSMLDLRETGLYSTAVSLAEMLWMIPFSVGVVLFPSIARASGPERDRLTLAVCRNSFWLMAGLCVLLGLTRNLAIGILFGRQFLPASPALLAILPGILAMSVQQVLGADLGGRGRPLAVTLGAAVGLVANIALNFLWIPRFGIVGASLASSVSYTLVALVVAVAFLRISGNRARDAFLPRREDWNRLVGILGRPKPAAV